MKSSIFNDAFRLLLQRAFFVCLFVLPPQFLKAQEIGNLASFRMMEPDTYARIHYENDFFTATDYYYSQGIQGEFVHPWFRRFFLTKVLISGNEQVQNGISVEHNGFTPTSTDHNEILFGDRPYAATLTMKVFSMSRHDSLNSRIASALSFGVIGPAAGGRAMQSTIHQWINDSQPLGWQNQIENDIVLNYELGLEKNLFRVPQRIYINGFATGNAGTLNTKLSTGLVLIAGRVTGRIVSVFDRASAQSRGFTFHFYLQPMVTIVGYDATLQGGLFNDASPYTIASGDLDRLLFRYNAGVVMQVGPIYLEYFYTFRTKEFKTGLSHTWGGVRIGARL